MKTEKIKLKKLKKKMTEEKHSLKYAEQLNTIGIKLTTQVTELLNEVDNYNFHYYNQKFFPELIMNDKGGIKTRREIKNNQWTTLHLL